MVTAQLFDAERSLSALQTCAVHDRTKVSVGHLVEHRRRWRNRWRVRHKHVLDRAQRHLEATEKSIQPLRWQLVPLERRNVAGDDHLLDGQRKAASFRLDMATKCECHPIHLVFLARTTYGAKKFDAETVQELHDNLLAYDDEHNENPTSAEAYDIDDDAVALESGKEVVSQSKKRSRLMTAGEALTQDCYLTDCEGDHTDF